MASHLVQALLHDLKAEAWPLSPDVPTLASRGPDAAGRGPTRSCAVHADRGSTWSALYRRRVAPDCRRRSTSMPPLPVPAVCPVTLDELLAEPPEA